MRKPERPGSKGSGSEVARADVARPQASQANATKVTSMGRIILIVSIIGGGGGGGPAPPWGGGPGPPTRGRRSGVGGAPGEVRGGCFVFYRFLTRPAGGRTGG